MRILQTSKAGDDTMRLPALARAHANTQLNSGGEQGEVGETWLTGLQLRYVRPIK